MTDEQRDNILIRMSGKLDKIDQEVKTIRQDVDRMNQEVKTIRQDVDRINQEVKTIQQDVDKMNQELEKQRVNIAKLEYNLTDKIMALFDLCDVNKDKTIQNNLIIGEIQNTLDWHHRRLLNIERKE